MATVTELIDDARIFAADANQSAVSLVEQAVSAISTLGSPFIVTGPSLDALPTVDISEDVPEFQGIAFEAGEAPAAPADFTNLPSLDVGLLPENTAVAPDFIEPPRPDQLRQLAVAPPEIITSFAFPALPAELNSISIVAPTMADHAVPTSPELQIPVFAATAPTDDISSPSDYVEQLENAYRGMSPTMMSALSGQIDAWMEKMNPEYSAQLARMEGKLAAYVEGGTGLSAAVENAIFERSKDKTNAEYRRTRDAAYADAARRGFTLPDGVLNASVQQARQAGADNNSRASVEIAIKQAELEQQNIQFALTLSSQLRTVVLNAGVSYHGSLVGLNGQALDYAKSVLSAAVEVYNTLVKAYSLKLEAYKSEAAVYETRLKGTLALVDIYRAEISALEALTNVDRSKVDIYKARLDSLNTLGNVYRTQIDAVIGQATIEKMKVELFGSQVQAYAVEAQAKNAEWQGYSAAVNGQEARMKAYGEEVRAYSAQVEGYRAKVQAKQAEVQSITSYNQGVLAQYTAAVDGYKVSVDAKSRVASTQIELQRSQLMAFQARLSAEEAKARLTQEYYKTKSVLGQEAFRSILQAAVSGAEQNTNQIKAVASTSLAAANVYQGLASAALAGQNTLVTKSESE
jgi:hypothetical protein